MSEISLVALLEDLGFVKDRTFREQTSFTVGESRLRPDIFVRLEDKENLSLTQKLQ